MIELNLRGKQVQQGTWRGDRLALSQLIAVKKNENVRGDERVVVEGTPRVLRIPADHGSIYGIPP